MQRTYDSDIRDDEQILSQAAIAVEKGAYAEAAEIASDCFAKYSNYSYPGLLLVC
jgi:hypothetical protein